ncbi:MAG TPA: hypothetical protein VKB46_20875 [Pyrinomonadaceae bacterium]|nr:hypothetical protein [Pyrinomonadaceae bacterium]
MNQKIHKRSLVVSWVWPLFLLLLLSPVLGIPNDKITVEEIIAKHLDSIGKPEARAANKSRIMQGSVLATIRMGGKGQSRGGSVMASQGMMSLIGLVFGPQEYSNEKAAFDGKRLTLGEFSPGMRTKLGGFLLTHDVIFREGLLGGTLSTAWPLLNIAERAPKLKYVGTKNIDGRLTHVLRYEPRSGGNLEIRLYFDAETFRHVRTEYQQDIAPPPVNDPAQSALQKETHLKLTEEFSDFKSEAGLVLPHDYRLQLTFDSANDPLLQDWTVVLTQFVFNQPIPQRQFDLTAK